MLCSCIIKQCIQVLTCAKSQRGPYMAGAKVDLSPQKLAKRVYTYIHAALQKAVFFTQ